MAESNTAAATKAGRKAEKNADAKLLSITVTLLTYEDIRGFITVHCIQLFY